MMFDAEKVKIECIQWIEEFFEKTARAVTL